MRETRDSSGRMPYRLLYEETEIDSIMEDELRRAGNPRLDGGQAVDMPLRGCRENRRRGWPRTGYSKRMTSR
jgi:hypothetical protein